MLILSILLLRTVSWRKDVGCPRDHVHARWGSSFSGLHYRAASPPSLRILNLRAMELMFSGMVHKHLLNECLSWYKALSPGYINNTLNEYACNPVVML